MTTQRIPKYTNSGMTNNGLRNTETNKTEFNENKNMQNSANKCKSMTKEYKDMIQASNDAIDILKKSVNVKLPMDLELIRSEAKKTNALIKL